MVKLGSRNRGGVSTPPGRGFPPTSAPPAHGAVAGDDEGAEARGKKRCVDVSTASLARLLVALSPSLPRALLGSLERLKIFVRVSGA